MLLQAIRAISSLGADAVTQLQTLQLGKAGHSLQRMGRHCAGDPQVPESSMQSLCPSSVTEQALHKPHCHCHFNPGGWKGTEADVGVWHSFGGASLYIHPLLCLYSLQQSYSPELPEGCPCLSLPVTAAHTSRHSGAPFPWIPLGWPPNHHNHYRLRELWGDAADHNFVYASPKYFCHLMLRLVLISLHCTRVWSWKCLAVQELCWPWACTPDLSCRNPNSSLGAKRFPLPSSPRAVPGQTHIHSVLGVFVQLSCAPGPPCPEHAGTFESQLEVNQRRHIIHIWCVKPKQPVHIFFYNEISSFLADFSQAHKLLIPLITYHA